MIQTNEIARRTLALMTVFLLMSGTVGTIFTVARADGDGDFPAPDEGDWVITQETTVTDETIAMNGNILIRNGGTLYLENVDLIFNSGRDGEFRLEVQNGGKLIMYNSTVDRGTDFAYGFQMFDGGSLRVENSEFHHCGYNAWNYYGLTIYGNDAVVRNNLFTQGYMGVYSYVASGQEITGNSFINNTHVAVYFHIATDFLIEGNLLDHNNYAIYMHSSSDGIVDGNEVRNNTGHVNMIGIYTYNGNNIMIRNNIVNESSEALYTHTSTNITFENNEANRNTRGIRAYSSQHIEITGNRLFDNIHGIYADNNNEDFTVRFNNASFNRDYNMYFYRTRDSVISENDIKNVTVYYGIAVRECTLIEISDNTITGNTERGLWIWDANNITMTGNLVTYSNIGYYNLRSQDTIFTDGEIRYSNYGVYLDGSIRNLFENSTSANSNNYDLHMRGASTEFLLLNSAVDTKDFHDDDSTVTERFYLEVEMQGRTGPIGGVDVEVTELDTGTVIYATPAFGGSDSPTDEFGKVQWIQPLFSVTNKAGSTLNQVMIRVDDHGIFDDIWYGYMERQKTITFTKSALTVDKGGNGDYVTIGEAIDAASPGDSILVASGTYTENLVIDTELEIYGKGGAVILDASGGTGFMLRAMTIIGNITFTNAAIDLDVQANTTAYNVTFATSSLDASHFLSVGHYLTVHTVDENTAPITRANVTIENAHFAPRFYESDPNGLVRDVPLVDFADSSSEHLEFNPYTINASKLFQWGRVEVTIDQNTDLFINLTRHGNFGASVLTIDIDRDGFDDYIVGAPADDEGGEDAGAVFIFYGPQTGVDELRPIDADVTLTGERIKSWYGSALDSGDINGDGLIDLIVGSAGYNTTGANGLLGYYWNSDEFTEFEYTRIDPVIDFQWGNGGPPGVGGSFSINWTGFLYINREDDYTFYFEHDDGIRMDLNGQTIVQDWSYSADEATHVDPIHLTPGYYPIDLWFYDGGGQARLVMKWETPEMEKQVISTEHLFYNIDMEPGNGAVYVYSGELLGERNVFDAGSGSRQDGSHPGFGTTLSTGDLDEDGRTDILVGFEGGTQVLLGNIMLYNEDFQSGQLLSSEWDPLIIGGESSMYIGTPGVLSIDSSGDADDYVYTHSKDRMDRGIGLTVKIEIGANTMFIAGIDYKVPIQDVDDLPRQEDHTLFSLYANGQIKYWPTFGGDVQIENLDMNNREQLTFKVIVTPEYDHMRIYLDSELLVDTPISGWDPVYLKLGDSTSFGMAVTNVLEITPALLNRTIMGWEDALLLDNDDRSIAATLDGETYLFSVDLDDYFQNSSASRAEFMGTHNYTTYKDGLTLSPFYSIPIVPNGNFDDGWDNWTQTENIRDKSNADYDITEEVRGDWMVYDGPTAGIGPDRDEVNSGGYNGRDCDGKIYSEPFFITSDVKYIDFWYHAKWWSFEVVADNNQDDHDDMIIYRVIRASDNTTVDELIFRKPPSDGEEEGRYQFDVSSYAGEYLVFEMEQVTNFRQYDDGLAQVDDITGAKENEDLQGYFISDLMEFDEAYSAFAADWTGDENGGSISILYRTGESEDWSALPSGLFEIPAPSTEFQYRVDFEGLKNNPYPVVEDIHFSFYRTTPEHLATGSPVDLGPIIDAETLGIIDGSTLTLYEGSTPRMVVTASDPITAVSSPGDLDINDQHDLLLTSADTVHVFLLEQIEDRDTTDSDHSFSGDAGFGSTLQATLVGSPDERVGDGRTYVLPVTELNLALVSLNLEDDSLIYPHTSRTLRPVVKNTGLERLEDVELTLEITAPSYFHTDSFSVSLDPGEEIEVPFTWVIPEDEGVTYTVRFSLEPDMAGGDNSIERSVTTRYHALDLHAVRSYDPIARDGVAEYHLILENTGTLGADDVTFDIDMPAGWDWWISKDGTNITSIEVTHRASFDLFIRTTSDLGIYDVEFRAISENGTADDTAQLEVHIVDRDIMPISVVYLREDGKEGTPISGENTTAVLTIQNLGTEVVGEFNTTLYIDDVLFGGTISSGIAAENITTISFSINLLEGDHSLRFVGDEIDIVREYDEYNNEFVSAITVKPEISSVPFLFRVHVTDREGADFEEARIRISSGSTIIENLTDADGNSLLTIQSYPEGDVYIIEALSGELYATTSIAVYSEDVEAVIELVVGRYSFDLVSDSRDKEIAPGGSQSYLVNITNTGDFGDNFTITLGEIPMDWASDIRGPGYDAGTLTLGKDETVSLTVTLDSWQYAPAHQRYEFTFTSASMVSPNSVNSLIIRATVTVSENVTLYTEMTEEHGLPRDPISHRIWVNNTGNAEREITIMVTGDVEYSEINKYVITLQPGDREEILFVIIIPNLRAGTVLHHELYGVISGVGSTESLVFTTSIDRTSGQYMAASIQGQTLVLTNNGNAFDHITISASTHLADILLDPAEVDIDMGESVEIDMGVTMLDLSLPAGARINVYISLFNGQIHFINSSKSMTVPEVHRFELEIDQSMIQSPPGSLASFEVLVRNVGNVEEHVFFTGTNSGPEPLRIPGEIDLNRNQEMYVTLSVPVPEDAFGTRTIEFTALNSDYQDTITLDLDLSVTRDIQLLEISARPSDQGTKYTINILNHGDVDEVLTLTTTCGEIDLERTMVPANDYVQFHVIVPGMLFCADTITVNASSDVGEGIFTSIDLIAPPFVTIDVLSSQPTTISNPVILQASGDYSSYRWLVDGRTVLGDQLTYSFSSSGVYLIELEVFDDRDISTTFYMELLVDNLDPVIETQTNLFGDAGEYIGFDARDSYDPDGTIVDYRWIIGNDTYFGPHVHHRFDEGGSYSATLRITDNAGAFSTTQITVTVRPQEIKDKDTVEKKEIDMQLVGISGALLLVLVCLVVFMFFKMDHEENTMVERLNTLGSSPGSAAMVSAVAPTSAPPPTRTCTKCGHGVPGDFKFCNKCGTTMETPGQPQPQPATPPPVFCTECGSNVPGNFKFCNKCGSPMDDTEVGS